MTQKTRIAGILGERGLVMPALVNAGLAANDRAKYYFTLLQGAAAHASRPDRPAPDLRRERLACGIDDASLDAVVGASRAEGDGLRIPGASSIARCLVDEVAAMAAPFAQRPELGYGARLDALRASVSLARDDGVRAEDIDALTRAAAEGPDSLHRLVMDLHKALNAEQAAIASENIDGASVYGIDAADRPLVAAFMRGVRRTAPLKFDHPGLETTATRDGARLVIQNDIGVTDAHVLIVHVQDSTVTMTYSDVHLPRLLFFQNQFEHRGVEWSDTFSRRDEAIEGGVFHLCEGTFRAANAAALEDYLAFLASRLVFLIDWNKARKRLRELVSKGEANRLLSWAAQNDYGHMAFLKAGGELLVYDALDFVMKGRARFGQKLSEILGAREAGEFLGFVLKTCAEALLRGESESFVQDAVRAELFNNFRTLQEQLYDVVADHASLTVEIAGGVRDSLLELRIADAGSVLARGAGRAKEWETRAGELGDRARGAANQADPADFFRLIVEAADVAADELEEAAFNLTLLPQAVRGVAADAGLPELGELLVQGTKEYLKVVESARHVRRGGVREDIQDFLAGIHRIQEIEHGADETQRDIKRELVARVADPSALYVLMAVTGNLEHAADALMHCGSRMREHVLNDVLTA
ncbi:MAG: hypothetical protein ACXWBQ_04455 [Usitatibacter sp.]